MMHCPDNDDDFAHSCEIEPLSTFDLELEALSERLPGMAAELTRLADLGLMRVLKSAGRTYVCAEEIGLALINSGLQSKHLFGLYHLT